MGGVGGVGPGGGKAGLSRLWCWEWHEAGVLGRAERGQVVVREEQVASTDQALAEGQSCEPR